LNTQRRHHHVGDLRPTQILALLSLLCLLLCSGFAVAERVQVSFALDNKFIESYLRNQVFTGNGESLRLNDDGTGCQFLRLSEPRISTRGGQVIVRTEAQARAGRAVGGDRCMLLLDWRGGLEFTQNPQIGADGQSIVLNTASWRALRPDGTTDTLSTTIGGWLERFLPAELKRTELSFVQPISQLADFLRLVITSEAQLDMLNGIAIDTLYAGNNRVDVTMSIEGAEVITPSARPEAALSEAELAALEQQLDRIDDFFTFAVKSLNNDSIDPASLFEILVELRLELMYILRDPRRQQDEPVRKLFVRAWNHITPTLQMIAGQQTEHESALQFLTFIAAGDALRALDELGPGAGIEITSNGLRRLARILVPMDSGDSLIHSDLVDPELRRRLGFSPPIPPPQQDGGTSWLNWFIPSAHAATALNPATVKRLNNWVPKAKDIDTYLPMVREVLHNVVAEQLRATTINGSFHNVYPIRYR
jgi:hypothetical protein